MKLELIKEKLTRINEKRDIINIFIMIAVFLFFFFLMEVTYYVTANITFHNDAAMGILRGVKWVASHPAYHFSIAALYKLFGGFIGLNHLSVIFLALLQVLQYYVVEKFFFKTTNDYKLSSIFGLIFLILGSVYNIFTGYFYLGQGTPVSFHSATCIMMRVFLVIFMIYFWDYYKSTDKKIVTGILVSLLFAFVTLIKPTATIIILPVFFLLFCYLLYKKENLKASKIVMASISSIALLFILYIFTFGSGSGAGVTIYPFAVWRDVLGSIKLAPTALICTAFAPLVLVFIKRVINKEKLSIELKSSWLMLAVATFIATFIYELGPRATHGNFFGTLRAAFIIIYLFSFYEYFKSVFTKKQKIILLLALLMHLVSSVIYIILLFQGYQAWSL